MKTTKITHKDKEFPEEWKEIKQFPKELYCIGDVDLLQSTCIATVGSRSCTAYGRAVARRISTTLAKNNITVVSGLAQGIDMECHQAALDAGGNTIAVQGCGIDLCYPPKHRLLKEEISKRGLVISEYPAGYKPKPYTFPARNRIIASISVSTVVIEAGYKSGALITAEMAIDRGKLVYAVPGNITSPSSLGTNKLLQDGAMPLVVPEDLLTDLGIVPTIQSNLKDKLSEIEFQVYSIILENGEITFDEIKQKICVPISQLNGIITILEMKGIIISSFGKLFIVKF